MTNNTGATGNIWISESCANSLGGPSLSGDWNDLLELAPGLDSVSNPCDSQPIPKPVPGPIPDPGDGYVFSRTDKVEFRWIGVNTDGMTGNIWIDQFCSDRLGGPSVFGDWTDLTSLAPAFDSVDDPCDGNINPLPDPDPIPLPPSGYVFSRSDTEEFRWIDVNADGSVGNIWIDQSCSDRLGGPTVFGDWNDLISIAPAFDSIDNPCDGNINLPPDPDPIPLPPSGYVFSRSDKVEFRWIDANADGSVGNIWIDQSCSDRLGGPTEFGNWNDLLSIAPAFDSLDNPCDENINLPPDPTPQPLPIEGYVFSRTDKVEFRWISPSSTGVTGNIWIDESCANDLGGATVFGTWHELVSLAPALDSIDNPCN